ncbi:MAG TPA: xanthine dehydrogenase family protein molybdopterin-binding subunit [Verrucomicrobiae bacterium]|nr:xanthine dehydrogenase family protein molybdopterin-binding subunit [Verrucomicrobiae bacterium]
MNPKALSPRELGKPMNRVDGRLKVTGAARYAAEFNPAGVLQAVAVKSSISHGRIVAIDIAAAEDAPGVKLVITHLNALKLKKPKASQGGGIQNEQRMPLSDDQISYGGQYVALVVADSLEQAQHAASLITINYDQSPPTLKPVETLAPAKKPKKNNGEDVQLKKGDVDAALADKNLVVMERTYETPTETHNPMEPSATVAEWTADGHLLVQDATQFVKGLQNILAQAFDLKPEQVRVVSPFVGGAFGCKGAVWPHPFLAAMAAKMAGAPVKFSLTRQDMFSGAGHRTPTIQTIALAATREGKLQAIRHQVDTLTSPLGDFTESCGARSSGVLYDCPAITVDETVYTVNIATPTFMRAPGECPGTYALECAMDELAVELKMDPLALRLANYSEVHPINQKPWSTKHLRDAYRVGAEQFGWSRRTAAPGSMRKDGRLVGWGLATATYPGYMMAAEATAMLRADGTAIVRCAAHDIGTGAYTVLTQISAEALGVPVEKVTFELGDSNLPYGPVAGGSNTTATVGSAIYSAAADLHKSLTKLAVTDRQSPLYGADADKIITAGAGRFTLQEDSAKSDGFTDILQRAGKNSIEGKGGFSQSKLAKPAYAFQSFGAHFCEVQIDPDLPQVRVTRMVSVMDCGRVMNAKTARSQILGGVVMGIGMALLEETVYDPVTGLPATRNLADYHVPVNADIRDIDVHFVGEPDLAFNPMGARGMGEIGITGTAAAVANAVYHATGKRVRQLPITIDKLLV